MTLVSTVGGAAGPLYGTLFLQLGDGGAGRRSSTWPAGPKRSRRRVKGVQARGKAAARGQDDDRRAAARARGAAAPRRARTLGDALRRSADAAARRGCARRSRSRPARAARATSARAASATRTPARRRRTCSLPTRRSVRQTPVSPERRALGVLSRRPRRPSPSCAAPPCATCDSPSRAAAGSIAGSHSAALCQCAPQRLDVGPEADRQAGGVGGAERRRLGDDRPHDGHVEHVGERLHEQVVGGHAAVDLERAELHAGVGVHRVDDLARLPRRRLEHGAGEVALRDVAGQPGDHAARVAAPVRREQPGERGTK